MLEELTQLEADLYAWHGDEMLWAWLEGVHAEHSEYTDHRPATLSMCANSPQNETSLGLRTVGVAAPGSRGGCMDIWE